MCRLISYRLNQILPNLTRAVAVVISLLMLNSGIRGAEIEPRTFSAMDTFALEWATDPRISPNAESVVYVRRGFDIKTDRRVSALWTVDLASGNHLPVTEAGRNQTSPRWAPQGDRIAYIAESESGTAQLYLYWLDYNRSTRLTQLTEGPSSLTWSPDGKWLAFSMLVPEKAEALVTPPPAPEGAHWAKPPIVIDKLLYRADGAGYLKDGYRQVFLISAEGGAPRQITQGAFHHGGSLSFSPDSRSLYVSANRHDDWQYDPINSEIYRVRLETGEISQLTHRQGPDSSPAVSPNGKYLAYRGFDDNLKGYQISKLYLMALDSGASGADAEISVLTPNLDRSVSNLRWDESSRAIYFQYDDAGETHVARVNLNGKITNLASHVGGTSLSRPYTGGSYSSAKNKIVFTQTSTRSPANLAIATGRGKVHRLTSLNSGWLPHRALAEVEEISVKSSVDSRSLQAWIAKPTGFDASKAYPMILEIHGGPFAAYGPHFSVEVQQYASAGYLVLYMNPRGSSSYGEAFGNLIHHAYPGNDFFDLMSGVDALIAKGWADPEQLYITGGSGGGVLTAWAVGHTDRFRAAVSAKPVINWYSFVLTADSYNFFYKYWFDAFPWDDPDAYLARSPLSYVGKVTTPTMLMTGERDFRTPISEAEQFYQALKLRKVPSALVRIPGASHGIANRPSQLNAKVAHILAWFEKFAPNPRQEKASQ